MEESTTQFIASQKNAIYAIENVPCFACPTCEHTSFSQDVAKKLEQYTSGWVLPRQRVSAWMFDWNEPIIEIPKESVTCETKNIRIPVSIAGTF